MDLIGDTENMDKKIPASIELKAITMIHKDSVESKDKEDSKEEKKEEEKKDEEKDKDDAEEENKDKVEE